MSKSKRIINLISEVKSHPHITNKKALISSMHKALKKAKD